MSKSLDFSGKSVIVIQGRHFERCWRPMLRLMRLYMRHTMMGTATKT